MIKVFKFDLFDSYIVNPKVLTFQGSVCTDSFEFNYSSSSYDWIIPIPKSIEVPDINKNTVSKYINIRDIIKLDKVPLTFENKLYVHSDCTIPRSKVTQKYKRVLKPSKADICVIPSLDKMIDLYKAAIFVNKSKSKTYVIQNRYNYGNSSIISVDLCKGFPIGSKPIAINMGLRRTSIEEREYYRDKNTFTNENWEHFLNSDLIYVGPVLNVSSKDKWIGDLFYNKMHNVVTEDIVLETLGDDSNGLNLDMYESIKQMIESSDPSVIGLGLKTLSELDYKKYYNTAIHLLTSSSVSWRYNDMRSNSGVKFMLKFLGLWRNTYAHYSTHITQEDFDMLKETVSMDFSEKSASMIQNFKSRFPFANVDVKYDFSISPNLDTNPELSDDINDHNSELDEDD